MKNIDADMWREIVYYDPASPSGLRWRVERRAGAHLQVLNAGIGDVAGGITEKGYYKVGLDGRLTFSHRIVMALHGYDVSSQFVDHIDGDVGNNDITNLRLVSCRTNGRNQRLSSKNTSGTTGVSKVTLPLVGGKTREVWFANWVDLDGKKRSRNFSSNKHGSSGARKLAEECRKQAIKQLNAAGAGYTERHGA